MKNPGFISWAYLGSSATIPRMSDRLAEAIQRVAELHNVSYISHAGTVGDNRHRVENPGSYHNYDPPRAIDITAIRAGNQMYYMNNLDDKYVVAGWFRSVGCTCYHVNTSGMHLHVQI